MTYMTDTGRTAAILNYCFNGAAAPVITQPYKLRLMTVAASGNGNVNGTNGTEATGSNCPGYTPGGLTLGTNPFGSFSAAAPVGSNVNAVSIPATGTWTSVPAIEVWDSAATALRWLVGPLANPVAGVVNGDTVQFAAASLTANAAGW